MTTPFDEPENPPTEIEYKFRHTVRGRDFQLCETRRGVACIHYDRVHERFLWLWSRHVHVCGAFKRRLDIASQAHHDRVVRCDECRHVDSAMERVEVYSLKLDRMRQNEKAPDIATDLDIANTIAGGVTPIVMRAEPKRDLSDDEWAHINRIVAKKRATR